MSKVNDVCGWKLLEVGLLIIREYEVRNLDIYRTVLFARDYCHHYIFVLCHQYLDSIHTVSVFGFALNGDREYIDSC